MEKRSDAYFPEWKSAFSPTYLQARRVRFGVGLGKFLRRYASEG